MEIKNEVATVSKSQERMWEVISSMGEDVRRMMESAGTGNLSPIPEIEENPDAPVDEDTPLTEVVAGLSSDTTPLFFMKRIDVGEEVSSVEDSVTSSVSKKKPTKGSTRVVEEEPVGDETKLTPEGLQAHR